MSPLINGVIVTEHFFHNDIYYSSIEDLIDDIFEDESEIFELDDNWKIKCLYSSLEPVFELSAKWLMNHIDEDRFGVDLNDNVSNKVKDTFIKNIDFEQLNAQMPKLYFPLVRYPYENHNFYITKEYLVNYIL